MIILSLGFYYWQNAQLERALVPYSEIEKLKLEQKAFESYEKSLLYKSILDSKNQFGQDKWGQQELADDVKIKYIEMLTRDADKYFINFTFSNIIFGENKLDIKTLENKDSFANFLKQDKTYLFSFIDLNGEKVLNVTRNFEKNFLLRGMKVKNNFPIEVLYNLKKEYLIKIENIAS
jgi:hypothetical protein